MKTRKTKELKVCPWCLTKPLLRHHAAEWEPVEYYVSCDNPECPVNPSTVCHRSKSEEEAALVWNSLKDSQ